MIKRSIAKVLCGVSIIIGSLSGCMSSKVDNSQIQPKESVLEKKAESSIEITKVEAMKNVYYPQIKNFKSDVSLNYMNRSLKGVVDKYTDSKKYSDLKLDYKITKNDKESISVLFIGTVKDKITGEINIKESIDIALGK